MTEAERELHIANAGASFDQMAPDSFIEHIGQIAAQQPRSDGATLYERGSVFDAVGHSDRAVPLLYEAALARSLCEARRRAAGIQLASSLPNLGRAAEAGDLCAMSDNRSPLISTTP